MQLSIFRSREGRRPLVAGLLAMLGLMAVGAQAQATEVTGSATLTSDYVWRGTTQTQGDPAVQASFKVAGDSGFYGSVWGSNVEFAPETHASSEFDFTVGWAGEIAPDWALDVNVLRYQYPSTTVDLNWTELNGTLTYADNYWLSMGWSPEALGSEESGVYTQLGARFPINDAFRIEAAAGYYYLDDIYDESYAHGQISAVWAVKAPLELRLTAHATDSNAEDIFGDDFAGDRIEAAVQASF
ncbi:TorF family putative porin [Lysobacter panacisoli]|uniref:Porin n=1 Tax=Lysobacter panacisoli TaxID=1255263 RepID=A0ABP9LP04_9GAMM|nr:TorF family putative porin [Lysobacter panacisoli]